MQAKTAPTINLLTARRLDYNKHLAASAKAKVIAGIALVVYFVLIVGVFAFEMALKSQQESVESSISKQKLAVASQGLKEQRLTAVTDKSKSINSIMSKRKHITEVWASMRANVPAGGKLSSFRFSENELSLSIQVPHVIAARTLLDIFEQNNVGFTVSQSEVTVSRAEDAKYTLSVLMTLPSSKVTSDNAKK